MRTVSLPTLARRYRTVASVAILAVVQWLALVHFFEGLPVVEAETAVPLALMAFFHLTSLVIALEPADLRPTALLWRALFAANAGYGIFLVPIMMRPNSCCRTPFGLAAVSVLELYAPVLLARVCLRSRSQAPPSTSGSLPSV